MKEEKEESILEESIDVEENRPFDTK